MKTCACGCGESTAGGTYRPGHDAKHRKKIEERIGGLGSLQTLVDIIDTYCEGKISTEDFGLQIKQLMGKP